MSNEQQPIDGDSDCLTLERWHDQLIRLHEKLAAALTKDRKQINSIRMVLSIDDVTDICQCIEDAVGPEWFSQE